MTTDPERLPADNGMRAAAAAALADVDALGVSGDDRTIILEALLRARLDGFAPAAAPVQATQIPDGGGGAGGHGDRLQVQDGDVLGKIAAGLKIDRDAVELVYALQDGEPNVVVSAKKIASNKSLGTRQLGQLVAAARQIAGLDEWTGAGTIRPVAFDYGRLDPSNFAASLQQMDDVALIRGKGQQREVKITKPGLESTGDLVKSLIGGE
jgi:hypothetical protein